MSRSRVKIILFIVFFCIVNSFVYYLTEYDKNGRVKEALQSHISTLKTNYEIVLHYQKLNADAAYNDTINKDFVIDILTKAQTASKEQQTILRKKLYNNLTTKYKRMKTLGILQYHFVLPNNKVFLRMHKPDKFDDDLTNTRIDFKYVNETKQPISGFEQGRTAHGFRHVYPIFGKNNEHLGAVEISYGSEVLQENLTHISKLHSHFLVDKHLFDTKAWQRDDLILKYTPSAEHKDFMITMTHEHTKELCIDENIERLKQVRNLIDTKIKIGKSFAVYTKFKNKIDVVSFFPIKNIREGKVVAWLVSYENDEFIKDTINTIFNIRLLIFFGSLLLLYFIYKVLNQKEILDIEVKKKTSELNSLNENLKNKIKEEVEKNKTIQEKLFKSEKMASMGEMIGNIAHQWRQPLSVISSGVSGMQVQNECGILSDKEFNKTCEMIGKNAQYLSSTIDDFRNFIKGDGKRELINISDNLNKFLDSIESTHINIILNIEENIQIMGNSNEFIQCFINIFNNSQDAIEKNNQEDNRFMFIDIYTIDDKVVLNIKDNGGGIDEDIISKIFEPYFTTKHQSQGTGLGLNMVYNIVVNSMNGTIEVKNVEYIYNNAVQKGALFTITIPLS